MLPSGPSSLKIALISKTDRAKFISIRTIDFETDRFDGDPRDAILWVEHFEDYFGTKGLSYLFDPLHPALLRPDHLYTLKEFDLREETALIEELSIRLQAWNATAEIVALHLALAAVNAMPEGAAKFQAQVAWLDQKNIDHHAHPKPVMPAYGKVFTSQAQSSITDYEKKSDKQKKDSDEALGYFKSKLGLKISSSMKTDWNDPTIISYHKACATMDFIRQYMTTNPQQVMVGIESDFAALKSVHTVLGAQLLYLHFENLQDQCIIIGARKADAELISKMRGKMVGNAFTNFNFTTRLAEHGANPQPVVRMQGRAGCSCYSCSCSSINVASIWPASGHTGR